MITMPDVQHLLANGGVVVDPSGDRIGKIGQVFLDDETDQPDWMTVTTGLFGGGESFVPLEQAQLSGDDIQVPFTKDEVKDAPRIKDADGHLSQEEEDQLFAYYARSMRSQDGSEDGSEDGSQDGSQGGSEGGEVSRGRDTAASTGDAMTRSEERLSVGTENVTAGKARLRKYVVTENVQQTVPVSHEEVRLEREPVTEADRDAALTGRELTSEEHEVVLNEERVVTSKETVPVERVKLGTETVTEERQVDEQVAKEQIELDDSEVPERPTRRTER